MDAGSLRQWQKAPATTLWVLASFLLTLAAQNHWAKLRSTRLNFHLRSVVRDGEYWRTLTSAMCFDKYSLLQLVCVLLMLHSFASALERRVFKGRSTAFAVQLVVLAISLHIPGYYLKELRLSSSGQVYTLAMATWYAAEFRMNRVPLLGPLYVDAWLLPIVFLAIRYVQLGQNMVDLKQQLIGVAAGLLFKLLSTNPEAELQKRQQRQERAKQLETAAGAARENPNIGKKTS